MTMIEREPELLLLFMEFWAYGVREADVRPKIAARFAQVRAMLSQLISDSAKTHSPAHRGVSGGLLPRSARGPSPL